MFRGCGFGEGFGAPYVTNMQFKGNRCSFCSHYLNSIDTDYSNFQRCMAKKAWNVLGVLCNSVSSIGIGNALNPVDLLLLGWLDFIALRMDSNWS